MVEVAFLAAHALGAFDRPGLDLVYDAVTTTAARVLGVPGHRLEPGGNADLVVHHHADLREVLAHHAPPAHVVASGKGGLMTPPHPHRHRHRRHVHRRRRVRRGHRRAGHHQDAVDAGQPGRRLPGRHRQGARPARARPAPTSTRSRHGTTVATNQLLEGKVDRLGFVTNTGYEAMLEIARQSVPDGYGNSYFWVKPDRIVPRDLVKGVEGRLDVNGDEVRPVRRGRRPRGRALVPRPGRRHARRLLPARLRQPGPRGADARGAARGAPGRGRLAVERGAARVPRVRARDDHARRRGREAAALGVRHQHQGAADRLRRPRRSRST